MALNGGAWEKSISLSLNNEGEVSAYCQSILLAYSRILDPQTSPQERTEHEKVIEEFRSQNPLCIQCGLFLAQQHEDYLGIHLGLQLIEYFVRFRWVSLSYNEQLRLREEIMLYRTKVGSSGVLLPVYIKERIACVIVELLKKMWPQEWSSFNMEIFSVMEKDTHIELILLIFRRFAEDLLSYDSALTNQKKSVMLASLKEDAVLKPLFELIVTVFQMSDVTGLLEVAVSTLNSFVDWVDLKFLTMNNCQIVFLLLSHLLSSNVHRLTLCDCLTGIFSRKGALKSSRMYRELFLQVISSDVLGQLQHCISNTSEGSVNDDDEYVFLKKLCQMMVQIGVCQLLPLWETSGFTPPVHLQQYLNVMIMIFSHPSLLISSICLEFWNAVIHHQFFKSHPVLSIALPELVKLLREKQYKVGDPTQPLHISSHYSSIDFDGPEEYNIHYSKCKGVVNRLLTDLVQLNPSLFQKESADAVSLLVAEGGVGGGGESKMSPVFLKWDALISFLECWVLGLCQKDTLLEEAAPTGVAIIQTLLSFSPTDPIVAFSHLKALEGGLQNFIKFNLEELLQGLLEKILGYVVFPAADCNKFALTREQKQTRLTALHCLIHTVTLHAESLQPATQQLLDHYITLVTSDLLHYSEKCLFIEAFVMLSHFKGAEDQGILLEHLMSEVDALVKGSLKSAVSSLQSFMEYFNLNKVESDIILQDCATKCAQLCYATHTVMGVLQRSSPRVRRQCKAPDAVSASSFRLIMPLLINLILPLIKVVHQLWTDSALSLLSPYFQGIHILHKKDREAILGVCSTSNNEKTDLAHIQQQFILAYEQCVMSVGFAWINYGPESLSQVGLVEGILTMVFADLAETSQLRIKPIIRNLMIPMVKSCPPDHWQLSLAPLLTRFCSIAFNCLQTNWSSIIQQLAQCVNEESENQANLSEQVLMHQFTVNLTRQYIQLICSICLMKDGGEDVNEEMLDDTTSTNTASKDNKEHNTVLVISDLALSLFNYEEMQRILLLSVFFPLSWLDSYCVRKCINIATVIFEKIPPVQFGESFIYKIMEQLFLGLRTHGEDGDLLNSLITLSLSVYELSAHSFPTLYNLLASLPDCNEERVKSFNSFISDKAGRVQVKKRKEEFKKLLSGIIGKPVAQLHKHSPVFMDLSYLTVKKNQRPRKPVTSPSHDLTSLFVDNSVP